jgi:hypothetical protein
MIVYNKRGIPGPCAYGNPGAALDRPGGVPLLRACYPPRARALCVSCVAVRD